MSCKKSFTVECENPDIIKSAVLDMERDNVSFTLGEKSIFVEIEAEDEIRVNKIMRSVKDKIDLSKETIEAFLGDNSVGL